MNTAPYTTTDIRTIRIPEDNNGRTSMNVSAYLNGVYLYFNDTTKIELVGGNRGNVKIIERKFKDNKLNGYILSIEALALLKIHPQETSPYFVACTKDDIELLTQEEVDFKFSKILKISDITSLEDNDQFLEKWEK